MLMKLELSEQIFKKSSNIQSHEIPSSGSLAVPCGETDGHIHVNNLIVAFRNFANAPKIHRVPPCVILSILPSLSPNPSAYSLRLM
jgi:hypothetical protein